MRNKILLHIIINVLMQPVLLGNDIKIENVSIVARNIEEAYSHIAFDIKWQNSWRYDYSSGINNWDAAWVFVKFKAGVSDPELSGVSSSGTVLTVSNTDGLRAGMPLIKTSGVGIFRANTVIVSINSQTTITINSSPVIPFENASIKAIRIWEHAYLDDTGYIPGVWHGDGAGQAFIEPGLLMPGSAHHAIDNPVVGLFIYRSEPGHGLFHSKEMQVRWNYGVQGIGEDAIVDIKVFAVEMVYVPAGSFYIGSGGSETSAFFTQPGNSQTYKIISEEQIEVGAEAGMLFYDASPNAGDQSGPIPEEFPKGYAAFFCMKYSISQKQYVNFLNALTGIQQGPRFAGRSTGVFMFDGFWAGSATPRYRNGVRMLSINQSTNSQIFGNDLNNNYIEGEEDDGQHIAMNMMYFKDAAAYADWSAMRPMTEFEYEKAARGNSFPVPNGYAWATDQIAGTASNENGYLLNDAGEKSESLVYVGASTAFQGNAIWEGTARSDYSIAPFDGPVRVGVFARYNTNIIRSGASFWGIIELSGNVCETVISVGNAAGRSFIGNHGDGTLNTLGNADEITWPIAPNGAGIRGGSFFHDKEVLRISDRREALIDPFYRTVHTSFRLVRTRGCSGPTVAPAFVQGNQAVTPGTTEYYSSSGGDNYLWILPKGWEIISGQGTDTIEVYVGQYAGEIRVALINNCGAGPEKTKSITIN